MWVRVKREKKFPTKKLKEKLDVNRKRKYAQNYRRFVIHKNNYLVLRFFYIYPTARTKKGRERDQQSRGKGRRDASPLFVSLRYNESRDDRSAR